MKKEGSNIGIKTHFEKITLEPFIKFKKIS